MPLSAAASLCEAALKLVRATPINHNKHAFHVTVSMGLSSHLKGESGEDWVKRTDIALYESKHNGRDRLSLAYDPNNFNHAA
jgi:PleD family two-component response regulator